MKMLCYFFFCSHRNNCVRNAAAQTIECLVEKLGPEKIFNGSKDNIAEKLMPVCAQFLVDGSPDVR